MLLNFNYPLQLIKIHLLICSFLAYNPSPHFIANPSLQGKIKKSNIKCVNLSNKAVQHPNYIWIFKSWSLFGTFKHIFHCKWHCYTTNLVFTLITPPPQLLPTHIFAKLITCSLSWNNSQYQCNLQLLVSKYLQSSFLIINLLTENMCLGLVFAIYNPKFLNQLLTRFKPVTLIFLAKYCWNKIKNLFAQFTCYLG